MSTMSEFRLRVLAAREYGVVHCEFRSVRELLTSDDSRQIADALVRTLGLRALGTEWRELTRGNACDVLERVLGRDLAYGGQTMSATTAKELAEEFITLFPDHASFYTNGVFPPREDYRDGGWAGSWDPITRATFDTGVIAVGADNVGLLWIEDED
jgi:hypothetical protein